MLAQQSGRDAALRPEMLLPRRRLVCSCSAISWPRVLRKLPTAGSVSPTCLLVQTWKQAVETEQESPLMARACFFVRRQFYVCTWKALVFKQVFGWIDRHRQRQRQRQRERPRPNRNAFNVRGDCSLQQKQQSFFLSLSMKVPSTSSACGFRNFSRVVPTQVSRSSVSEVREPISSRTATTSFKSALFEARCPLSMNSKPARSASVHLCQTRIQTVADVA